MYEWIKALHVISIISWMAGLLYLPRLFVYHCDAEIGGIQSEIFKVMERRLVLVIMTPAMVTAWISGLAMVGISAGAVLLGGFSMWVKLVLAVVLTGVHAVLALHVREFARDRNVRSHRYFRVLNEVPTALMIGIVILVIVRPF